MKPQVSKTRAAKYKDVNRPAEKTFTGLCWTRPHFLSDIVLLDSYCHVCFLSLDKNFLSFVHLHLLMIAQMSECECESVRPGTWATVILVGLTAIHIFFWKNISLHSCNTPCYHSLQTTDHSLQPGRDPHVHKQTWRRMRHAVYAEVNMDATHVSVCVTSEVVVMSVSLQRWKSRMKCHMTARTEVALKNVSYVSRLHEMDWIRFFFLNQICAIQTVKVKEKKLNLKFPPLHLFAKFITFESTPAPLHRLR